MRLKPEFNREELNAMDYPVIVEMWNKVMSTGSGKQKYRVAFTQDERELMEKLHTMFHRWHLMTGTPETYSMPISTYALVERAVNFFGTYEG